MIWFYLGWDCVFVLTGNDLKIVLIGFRMDDFLVRKMEVKSSMICKIFLSVVMVCWLNFLCKKDDYFGMMMLLFV